MKSEPELKQMLEDEERTYTAANIRLQGYKLLGKKMKYEEGLAYCFQLRTRIELLKEILAS